jgi:hypothetical protein
MQQRKKIKKIQAKNSDKKLIIGKSVLDYTPFVIRSNWSATVFTSATQYLGRYQQLHPIYGPGGATNDGIGGLYSYVCASGGSSTQGLYYNFIVMKAKITLKLTNFETGLVKCTITKLPFNMIGLFTTNLAVDVTCNASKSLALGPAGGYMATGTMVCDVDTPQLNNLTPQQMGSSLDWAASRNANGTYYSAVYYQFLRADNANFGTGLNVDSVIEYVCVPKCRNMILND